MLIWMMLDVNRIKTKQYKEEKKVAKLIFAISFWQFRFSSAFCFLNLLREIFDISLTL